MRRSRTSTWLALVASVLLHGLLLAWCERVPPQQLATRETRVEVTVNHIVTPPPPTPEPEPAPPPVKQPPRREPRVKPVAEPVVAEQAPPPPAAPVVEEPAPAPAPAVAQTPPPAAPTQGVILPPGLFKPGKGGTNPVGDGKGTNLLLGENDAAGLAVKHAPPGKERADPPVLKKVEWKYSAFLERMKEQLRRAWRPEKSVERRLASEGVHGVKSGQTDVQVVMHKSGDIRDVIVQRSAAAFLDDEVIRAVRSISPAVNVPPGMFDESGHFRFTVGFEVQVRPPPAINRFLQSRSSVVGLAADLLNGEATDIRWCFKRQQRCGNGCLDTEPLMTLLVEQCTPPVNSGRMSNESPMGIPR